jgi:phosphatidate cytidylyltransferase
MRAVSGASAAADVPALASRVLVALVLLPLVLGLVYLGGWWLWTLALVGALIAVHEYYSIVRSLRPLVLGGYVALVLALLGAELGGVEWLLLGIAAVFPLAFVMFGVSDARPSFNAAMGATLLPVVWLGAGLGLLLLVRDIPEHGRLAIFTVLLAVFADDTFAYAIGRLVGRHKMSPSISPGKSWEGFAAGTLAAVAVAFFALYDQGFLTNWQAVVLGAAISLSAVVGDLFESAVKRDMGVKDSGSLLAGHGGVLDRLDSILFAGPTAYVVILAFGHV